MKEAYPIVISPTDEGYIVYIPDFDINTEGNSLADAIEMARDAIGLMGIVMEDDKEVIPAPSEMSAVTKETKNDIVTLVDVSADRTHVVLLAVFCEVNVTLPSWLDYEARKSGLNVSALLQKALKQELHITDR